MVTMIDGPERIGVIIDDDIDISNLLGSVLGQAGFTTYAFCDGLEGVEAVRKYSPILTTVDVSLPGIDGYEVTRRIRDFSNTFIIMLTALTDEMDTLMGLDAGADDYLTKPFRHRELRARVEAMLRRQHRWQPVIDQQAATVLAQSQPAVSEALSLSETEGWLEHNLLRIHPEMRLCEVDGRPVMLTRSEFDLLLLIMQRKRRVVSKEDLIMELHGNSLSGGRVIDSDRAGVDVHMANLRRKLGDSVHDPRFIETIRGVGYRLAAAQDRR